jgi:hypothetical protein
MKNCHSHQNIIWIPSRIFVRAGTWNARNASLHVEIQKTSFCLQIGKHIVKYSQCFLCKICGFLCVKWNLGQHFVTLNTQFLCKGKVKLSLCTKPWRRFGGVEVWLHAFFDLGTRWRWVVSFTPRPLYPQGKSPRYPLDRKLGGPQSRYGHGVEEKNFQPLKRKMKAGTEDTV